MLDGIDPWGLTGPDGLNQVAATFLGAALVLLGVGVAVGVVRWASGKAIGSSDNARKGLGMLSAGVLGAAVLGSIGGAIEWGSSLGTASLMPEAARPGQVVIDKKPPKTTCTAQAVRDFDDEDPMLTHAERVAVVQEVSEGALKVGVGEQVMTLKWYPTGTDCSADNTEAASGTEVELRVYDTAAVGGSDEQVRKHTVD
ncbi:hypothetical protein E7744_07210 [Citricoccus sp. SGAir0253]|uniref:hypothetical protein n=1 Tax=Citricoccus sp. SGAir0253 TaxID=2567881 RepID=UPI0010CCED03|nr:hypothetical protein [Citricoccus sp. SGAir0253]QCU77994.1 hypothetical protein E7744_07210 [Citricoccus sp. SGAir0253]